MFIVLTSASMNISNNVIKKSDKFEFKR